MAIVPIFTGRVTTDVVLQLTDAERPQRRRWLETLVGKDVEVIVRKKRTRRSLDLNAYWHAVPFPMIAEYLGEDIEVAKLLILGECFGWKETRDGHRLPVKPRSSELTNEEGSYLTEWMPPWALRLTNGRMEIPLPEKAVAA